MSSILSTKILSASQKELLLNAKLNFVEYNAIKVEFLDFKIDEAFDYYVFTSQNGVRSFLKKTVRLSAVKNKVLCVGEKTKMLLEENGLKVIEMAENSSELSKIISKRYKNVSFLIFSGNLRRPELPKELKRNHIQYKEIIVYNTHLNYKVFKQEFDGILFFSPSGVQSFSKENSLKNNTAFCIGKTTAVEAEKHTNQVIIANKPTVENVLVQVIKDKSHFRQKPKQLKKNPDKAGFTDLNYD